MSRDLINLFKKNADRVVGYNYDSFEKNPAASEWFRSVDLYMTFDIDDAAKFDLKLVHLFSAAPIFVPQEKKYLVTLIQRRHSDRLKHAKKICDAVPEDRRFIFLYEWSWLTFIVGFLQNPILYFQMRRYISRTPLKYKDAMEKMAESFVTFDYAFPGQSGITVRCFEAQSLGTAILTNNLAAVESGMFQGGSIAYMPPDASSDTISQSLAALATQRPAPRIRALEDFLNDILSATDKLT